MRRYYIMRRYYMMKRLHNENILHNEKILHTMLQLKSHQGIENMKKIAKALLCWPDMNVTKVEKEIWCEIESTHCRKWSVTWHHD